MKALILNSAHNKYPIGNDSWIRATVKAVAELSQSTDTFICSHDPMPWGLVTYLAGSCGMNIDLIVTAHQDGDRQDLFAALLDEYTLDGSKVKPLYPEEPGCGANNRKALWQLRDRLAVHVAQTVYPVSVRPGGRLSRLLDDDTIGMKIRNDFRIKWSSEGYIPRYTLEGKTINPLPPGEWLVHWTRASQGPWPGERASRFYRDLLDNPGEYVRSAGATLARIVAELRLRGSSWKLPEGGRAVAFTALPVGEALGLMRWRKRYVRYTFEPFGLAIRRSALIDLGARRVSYIENLKLKIENSESDDQPNTERLFVHAAGEKTDWTREKEWRIRGDLSLKAIDDRDMLALVPDEKAGEDVVKIIGRNSAVHAIFKER